MTLFPQREKSEVRIEFERRPAWLQSVAHVFIPVPQYTFVNGLGGYYSCPLCETSHPFYATDTFQTHWESVHVAGGLVVHGELLCMPVRPLINGRPCSVFRCPSAAGIPVCATCTGDSVFFSREDLANHLRDAATIPGQLSRSLDVIPLDMVDPQIENQTCASSSVRFSERIRVGVFALEDSIVEQFNCMKEIRNNLRSTAEYTYIGGLVSGRSKIVSDSAVSTPVTSVTASPVPSIAVIKPSPTLSAAFPNEGGQSLSTEMLSGIFGGLTFVLCGKGLSDSLLSSIQSAGGTITGAHYAEGEVMRSVVTHVLVGPFVNEARLRALKANIRSRYKLSQGENQSMPRSVVLWCTWSDVERAILLGSGDTIRNANKTPSTIERLVLVAKSKSGSISPDSASFDRTLAYGSLTPPRKCRVDEGADGASNTS